jgi:hypothetical protein
MHIAGDAANRMKKVTLETALIRRMLAASITYGFDQAIQQTLRDRLGFLQRRAAEVAAMVKAHLAGR